MTQGERELVAEMVKRHRSGHGNSFYGELAQLAEQLERALNDTNADRLALACQLTQAIRDRDELKRQARELQETVKVLEARVVGARSERDTINELLGQLWTERDELKETVKVLSERLADMAVERDELKNKVEAFELGYRGFP